MTSGGNGKPFFGGYAGSRQLGRPFKAPQPVTLGLSGFGGASIRFQPMVGWKKTMTPCDVRACIAVFRGLGDWSRRSRICPSPGASLHPARSSRRCVRLFAESVHPSDHVGETFGIPFNQPDDPFSSPPRRATVSRCPARLVRPLSQPYHFRSGNTRDKNLKNHDYLDHQANSLRVVDLGFKITSTVVMMTGVRATSRSS